MTDIIVDTASTDLEDSRQASEALSTWSGATAVNSDSALDAETDDFQDLFKLDLAPADTGIGQSNEAKPLNGIFNKFCQLPSEVLTGVFEQAEMLRPAGKCFKPFYKQGMLKGYIINKQITLEEVNADNDTSRAYVMSDNVDILARAFVTKQYAKAYIEAFYSHNTFHFKDPRAAMWFFKKLGNKFQYLRKLELVITGGLVRQTYNSAVDFCTETFEELWWQVLCWIEHRHRFERLSLIFKWSRPEYALRSFDMVDDDKIEEMMLFRQKIVCRLGQRWGIKSVRIEDKSNGFFANEEEMLEVQLAMQQPKLDALVEDRRNAPLSKVLQAAHSRKYHAIGQIDFTVSENGEVGYEEEVKDGIKEIQSYREPSGERKNGGRGSGTTNSTTESEKRKAKQKQNTETRRSRVDEARDCNAGQLLAESRDKQNQRQPSSSLRSTVASIGNNASFSSTSHRQATCSTIPVSQFYGSSSQQRNSGGSVNDVRNEYDRPSNTRPRSRSNERRSQSNGRRGNGRRNQNFYGNRRHVFGHHGM